MGLKTKKRVEMMRRGLETVRWNTRRRVEMIEKHRKSEKEHLEEGENEGKRKE